MKHTLHQKRTAFSFGLQSETMACWYLRAKGYRVVARNFKTPVGEIDIIVQKRSTLCFVEVKARKDLDTSLFALQKKQQNRILRAAEAFLSRNPEYSGFQLRFDLVALAPGRLPVHLLNAWWEEE